MEIINDKFNKEQQEPKYKDYTVFCEHCGSELRINDEDVYSGYMYFQNEHLFTERGYFEELIKCPCCKTPSRICELPKKGLYS